MVKMTITPVELAEATVDFKDAWNVADKLGYQGRRTMHALRFALENLGIEIKGDN